MTMKHYLMSALFLSAIRAIIGQNFNQIGCFMDLVNADDEVFQSVCPEEALVFIDGVSLYNYS